MDRDEIIKRTDYANAHIKYMDIKGKKYAPVSEKVKAFRYIYPDGCLSCRPIQQDENSVTMVAEAYDGDGKLLANAYASETRNASNINRTSMIENCDTGAKGRALAFLNIGVLDGIASAEEVDRADKIKEETNALHICRRCGRPIIDTQDTAGKIWTADEIAKYTLSQAGDCYCLFCLAEIAKAGDKFNKGAKT